MVGAGSTNIPAFYVQALTDTGTAQLRATAPGYTAGTSTITFHPSGFYLNASDFTTTASSANTTLTVSLARLSPTTLSVAVGQELRGGLSNVNVTVTSSDATVGSIVNSPASSKEHEL